MTSSSENRPYKFGYADRRQFIVQDSEVALRVENDANGNPIYIGRAKVGSSESDEVWQIQKLTHDAKNSVTNVSWPENSFSLPSSSYTFSWTARDTYTYG